MHAFSLSSSDLCSSCAVCDNTRTVPRAFEHRAVQVYSDVDDTLQCSAGRSGAGIDVQLPHHDIYPGELHAFSAVSCAVTDKALADAPTSIRQ